MKILGIIPARGGSKRLPNKNAVPIMGRPSIAWAIDACKESRHDIDVVVSSDSKEILSIAKTCGAVPLERSARLAEDTVDKQDVIRSVCARQRIAGAGYDVVISLQANSPEVRGFMLDRGIDMLKTYGLWEVASVDNNGIQNAAFRIMRWDYVRNWRSVSSHFGVVEYDLVDIHTLKDVEVVQERWWRWHSPTL